MANGKGISVSFKVISWAIGVIFIAAIAYATVHFNTKRVDKIEPIVYENKSIISSLVKGQESLEANQERILDKLDDINKKL